MKTTLIKMLTHSGHGSRKDVTLILKQERVSIDGEIVKDPKLVVEPTGLKYKIDDIDYVYYDKVYLALNKPQNFECSHSPTHHESVFNLIPEEFITRNTQACGRLDADTTGLLIFTDDGPLNQKLTSPKRKLPKTYLVTLKHDITDSFMTSLLNGVVLKDSPAPAKAETLVKVNEKLIELTISEGRYHQVKRMVAAASNRVEGLKRTSVGGLKLEALNLNEGEYCILTDDLLEILFQD